MKTKMHTFFLAAMLISGTASRRVLEDIPIVAIGSVAPVSTTSSSSRPSSLGDQSTASSSVEEELIYALEIDDQVTVVGQIVFGELLCDTLVLAEDAALLSFALNSDEIITAEKLSYTAVGGDAFTDGTGHKIWTGIVIDPVKTDDEAVPRTVSMTWGDICDVETFLLKVTTRNIDGTTVIVKSIPCEHSTTHICLVEVLVKFKESGGLIFPDDTPVVKNAGSSATGNRSSNEHSSASIGSDERRLRTAQTVPARRNLQDSADTVIDVMILYSNSALELLGGISAEQMESTIWESMTWTNQAFVNSEISLYFNAVHIGLLPYEDNNTGGDDQISELQDNDDVADLRDETGADLVQLITFFDDNTCGKGFLFYGRAEYGFSLVYPTCLDDYSSTHEFGHNLGCDHDRQSSSTSTDYSHGLRYCSGDDPYGTVMSYSCGSPRVIYFSNPDVTYLDRPTGTDTEDNARTIKENMVDVSNYRDSQTTTPSSPATPTIYSYLGCYGDIAADRVLSGDFVKGDDDMTTETCAQLCEDFTYFGTQYGTECFCGPSTDDPFELNDAICDYDCSGDGSQTCGGYLAISVYEYTSSDSPVPEYLGCWGDKRSGRIMEYMRDDPSMTNDLCETLCSESAFFGTQYGKECWCGAASTDYKAHGESTDCDYECSGDTGLLCGGYFAMSVWSY